MKYTMTVSNYDELKGQIAQLLTHLAVQERSMKNTTNRVKLMAQYDYAANRLAEVAAIISEIEITPLL